MSLFDDLTLGFARSGLNFQREFKSPRLVSQASRTVNGGLQRELMPWEQMVHSKVIEAKKLTSS